MAINQTATGNDSVAIAGTASNGERTIGVKGTGDAVGVHGEGKNWHGVEGISHSTVGGFGVFGTSTAGGTGVAGVSTRWIGVYGETAGVENGPAGVWGEHKGAGIGVKAISKDGIGLYAFSNKTAAVFQGNVEVSGDIRLTNADCAEDFNIGSGGTVEPGTVMVLGDGGALFPAQRAYDTKVAGVVSGAGDYKPGIVLDKQESENTRQPIALLGKVFCKVDAQYGAIELGDLLTTSPTAGHAMKVGDPLRAAGAVIGKALRPLEAGQGLLPILITLQ